MLFKQVLHTKKMMAVVVLTCMMLILLNLIGVEKAFACSCVVPGTYAEELEKNSHVLDATVVDKNENKQGELDVELSVQGIWKGEAERETHVITADNSAACGYNFNIGTRYAVFAQEVEGELHVSLCSVTAPINDDSAIFTELGQPQKLEEDSSKEPSSRQQRDEAGNRDTAVPTSVTANDRDPLSPEEIEQSVTEEELVHQLDTQHSMLVFIFIVVGALFIFAALFLFLSRRKR